ncbi:glycoside hydrolase family 9 protein [Streptomyces sp. NPDC054770]
MVHALRDPTALRGRNPVPVHRARPHGPTAESGNTTTISRPAGAAKEVGGSPKGTAAQPHRAVRGDPGGPPGRRPRPARRTAEHHARRSARVHGCADGPSTPLPVQEERQPVVPSAPGSVPDDAPPAHPYGCPCHAAVVRRTGATGTPVPSPSSSTTWRPPRHPAHPDPDEPLFTAFPSAFYPEDSWQDDLEFAAAELALAARDVEDDREGDWTADAAHWARAYLDSDVKGTLDVADVSALAHADLALALDGARTGGVGEADLYRDLRRQLDDGVDRAGHDPFGAGAVYDDFDAVPHTFGLVATARLYAKATEDTRYEAFAGRQRGWALGANPWGTSFVIGAGEVYPHCPEHQLANLRGSHDGKGAILRGAVVNGPNAAARLTELNTFPTMKKCTAAPPAGAWTDFDGKGSRYVDDVGAWQTVEPSLDFTTTALLAFALT